jgi:predicted metal-dependent hydrolase
VQIDKLIRSKRKTVALIVERDGRLVVRAPKWATEVEIRQIVSEKADWIRAKQAEAAANPPPAAHKYVDGELFYYLGEQYPLRILQRQKTKLRFSGDAFQLRQADMGQARECFVAWYREAARKVIMERLAIFAPLGEFEYKRVRITSAQTRWGSRGSGGGLNFTWRLVMAPLSAIDYVVVHELAHLQVPGHQKEFWNLVSRFLPDYKVRRKWFYENGHLLVL